MASVNHESSLFSPGEENNSNHQNNFAELQKIMQDILDNTEEIIIIIDKEFNVKAFNKKTLELTNSLLGLSIAKGEPIFKLMKASEKEEYTVLLNRVIKGEKIKRIYTTANLDGTKTMFRVNYIPITEPSGSIESLMISTHEITSELMAIEEELRQSENNYRTLFDHNPMPMWIYETETKKFLEANLAAIRHYGYSREEFLEMTILDIRPESEISRLLEYTSTMVKDDIRFSGEWTHRKKNGESIIVEIKSHLINFKGKDATLVLINDISEKLVAQNSKEFERKNKLALINTTGDLIWSINNELELIASNKAFVERIKLTVGRDIKPGDKVVKEELYEGGYTSVWQNIYQRGLSGESLYEEIRVPGNLVKKTQTYWLGVTCHPIYENDKIIGLACYARDISRTKSYEIEVEAISKRVEVAMDIARLGYWELDESISEIILSKQVAEILGLSSSNNTLDYKKFIASIHEDDRDRFDKAIRDVFTDTEYFDQTYRIISLNGDIRFINHKGIIVYNDTVGKHTLESMVQDITERIRIEQALTASEKKYRDIFELSPLPQWIYSIASFRILDVNQAAITHYGYTRSEFLEMTVKDLRPEGEVARLIEAAKVKPSPGTVSYGQWKHRKKDGSMMMVEISGHEIDYNGIQALLVVSNDITERIRKDNELQATNQRLEAAQKIARLGYWQHDFVSGEFYWSNEMYRMFDYKPGEITPNFEAALERIPKEEHPMFVPIVERARKTDGIFEIQHSIITRSGERRTVVGRGNYSFNEKGEVVFGTGTVQDITHIRQIESTLQSHKQQLELIYNNVTDSIFLLDVVGERFLFRSVNNSFLQTTGLREEQVVGLFADDVIPEQSWSIVLAKYREAISDKKRVQWEEVTRYPTGIKYGIVSITPIFDEKEVCTMLLGSVHDITATREAAAELMEMNERFLHASKATSDAIWDWDIKSNSLQWGESYEQLTGFSINDLNLTSWENRIHPDDRARINESIYAVVNSDETNWQDEYRYLHRDGHYIFISDRGVVLRDAEGKPYRMIGAMQNISHLKETEIILKNLNQSLERRAAELAESNEELERFAYVASHDLQEPLRMVSSFLQLLENKYKEKLDADALRYIHFAVDGANRMKRLINDLLEYSRLDTRSELEETTDMNEIMNEISQNVTTVTSKNILLSWDELPVLYKSSRTQLYQLMQNLVSNAVKYNDKQTPEVSIYVNENDYEYIFQVRDNGIGIDNRFFEKVFIIFQRLHNQSDYSGTGIGLSICKKIVERHGGRMWIDSAEGHGSVFYFSISKKRVI